MAPSTANMTPAFVSMVFLTQAKHYNPPPQAAGTPKQHPLRP